jgi:hypothetical protein
VAITDLSVLARAHDLQQLHDVGRREEVQADHAFGTLVEAAISSMSRPEVLVARIAPGLAIVQLAEDLLLDLHQLEHRLDDQVAVG